jgi:DNA-binding NarL/FixJ family response regulator
MLRMPKKKVLVVDDHPSMRFLIRSLVESDDDFAVCGEAADGVEAIEKAKQLVPDLILLDFAMPRMTGGEAAVILKKRMPHLPIILFTLHQDQVNEALAATMRVDRVIAKTDGMTKVLECMREVLGLGPRQSAIVGPLAVPLDGPTAEGNHAKKSEAADEKPPQ